MSNTASQPCISVVIPCYNHGAYLPEAVASVRAQTHSAVECLIVDDGSTDAATRSVLDALSITPGVQVFSQSNQGLAAARNAGIRAGDTPFFVPLDADDRLDPRFIERLLPPLLADERASHAYCFTSFFGTRSGVWRCEEFDPWRLILHNLHPATALVRRAAFDAVGGYQTDMVHGYEDWDLWLALAAAGWRGTRLAEPLFWYRQHAAGQSMLAQMGERRREMRRRMIEHHRALFQRWLNEWLAPESSTKQIELDTARLLAELEAAIEVDFIERSRMWRWLRGGNDRPGTPPTERLRAIRETRRYRLIQSIKAVPPYRWFARQAYRPEAMRTSL